MHYAFPFLPLEVQASIKEMAALGIPESAIDLLIARTAKAIEDKTTTLQMDVVRIEGSIERRVDLIGEKLASDLRTVLGETNGMLVDIRTAQQTQEAAVTGLRAEFHDGMQAIGERVTDNTARIGDLEQKVAEHDQSRDQSIEDRRLLRQDMDESKAHRARIQETLDTALPAISDGMREMNERHGGQLQKLTEEFAAMRQQLLELAGNGTHEAGG